VAGGTDGLGRLRSVEKYNPVTRRWTLLSSMINPRSNFSMQVHSVPNCALKRNEDEDQSFCCRLIWVHPLLPAADTVAMAHHLISRIKGTSSPSEIKII